MGLRQRGLVAEPGERDVPRHRRRHRSPRRKALDELFAQLTPEFFVNYHSAAELLLHGIGWQVATPSPDDVIYEAMVGDDANPAVPGYDPDISAELYTTNGDIDSHMQEAYGTLGFTPEMSTCEAASESVPDDEWVAEDCESGFNFPDDEGLIQAEFEKNIPFALAVAESALDPDDPVSVVGRDGRGLPGRQLPGVVRRPADRRRRRQARACWPEGHELPHQRRTAATSPVKEWKGGERYGFENVDYYAEYRGTVQGAKPGDSVEVWFSGVQPCGDLLKSRRSCARPRASTSRTGRAGHRQRRAGRSPTRTTPASTPRTGADATPARSTSTSTSRALRPTASRRTCGTSTRRACRTTSAC